MKIFVLSIIILLSVNSISYSNEVLILESGFDMSTKIEFDYSKHVPLYMLPLTRTGLFIGTYTLSHIRVVCSQKQPLICIATVKAPDNKYYVGKGAVNICRGTIKITFNTIAQLSIVDILKKHGLDKPSYIDFLHFKSLLNYE